jgi:SAM-dependent methyltransferase
MTLCRIVQQLVLVPYRNGSLLQAMRRIPSFIRQFLQYRTLSGATALWAHIRPQLFDATSVTEFDPHYFYQSAWCARHIATRKPLKHVDIASQINLIAPLSAFVEVEFIDYRPLNVMLNGLTSRAGTILALPFDSRTVKSVSCLHVIEHIGLGRYGDALDPLGSEKACKELQRILATDGDLYLTTPVGVERVEFNAHRIHAPQSIIRFFSELKLIDFSCIDDNGRYYEHAAPDQCSSYHYGLGMFHFRRNAG